MKQNYVITDGRSVAIGFHFEYDVVPEPILTNVYAHVDSMQTFLEICKSDLVFSVFAPQFTKKLAATMTDGDKFPPIFYPEIANIAAARIRCEHKIQEREFECYRPPKRQICSKNVSITEELFAQPSIEQSFFECELYSLERMELSVEINMYRDALKSIILKTAKIEESLHAFRFLECRTLSKEAMIFYRKSLNEWLVNNAFFINPKKTPRLKIVSRAR